MPTAITHDPVFTTPVSSTNTAVVRWSGTAGAVLQDSGVLIDGSNNITGAGTIGSGAITSTGGTARPTKTTEKKKPGGSRMTGWKESARPTEVKAHQQLQRRTVMPKAISGKW